MTRLSILAVVAASGCYDGLDEYAETTTLADSDATGSIGDADSTSYI